MRKTLEPIFKPIASLRLTVVLLAVSMFLVFGATWAQIDQDIGTVVQKYFRSFIVWINFQIFLPKHWDVPGSLPFPGGYLLGAGLLVNLLTAHAVRFKITWKRSGILLIHLAILLFLAGEAITGWFAMETQMPIYEGQTVQWSQDIRETELAIIDHADDNHDQVVVVRESKLTKAAKGAAMIRHEALPFDVKIDRYLTNSRLYELAADERREATHGFGLRYGVRGIAKASSVEGGGVNLPAVLLSFEKNGRKLGTYWVSPNFQIDDYRFAGQEVVVLGKTYEVYLRFRRYYKPYAIKLIDFRFDKYTGTATPKNFSSDIQLTDPLRNVDRPVKIYMNHPLRYEGETFFQADWIRPERGTILQVVRNPGWPIPYIAFTVASLGLAIHFGISLVRFLTKANPRDSAANRGHHKAGILAYYLPWAVVVFCLVYLLSAARTPKGEGPYALREYASLPVFYKGRVKPFDTVARNTLLILSGRQTLMHNDRKIPAARWLLDVLARRDLALAYEVFRIDHPEVLSLFGWEQTDRKRFSYQQVAPHRKHVIHQAHRANQIRKRFRSSFHAKVLELSSHISIFEGLYRHNDLHLVPPIDDAHGWMTLGEAHQHAERAGQPALTLVVYAGMRKAYRQENAEMFNTMLARYHEHMSERCPEAVSSAKFEAFFNQYAPFARARALYVLAGLLILFSWLGWHRPLAGAAYSTLILTLLLHTCGLAARIYLSGRPPVTNLYSSAVFIGWGCVVFCLILERLFKNGIGSLTGAVAGFATLLVAKALEGTGNGDTMAVLQAVLDTNFWLATHVVIITLGYAGTFLAGLIGIVYIIRGVATQTLAPELHKRLGQMQYGVIAFALLFSLVGTVLGGIWADQSWGRFWGWDPKENGAILIVLFNALVLHARWGGMVKIRGIAVLTVFGNVVTSWSWFGTNMLGVGLHSYGFMDSAVFWLGAFVISQLVLIAVGLLPLHRWRSFASTVSATPPEPDRS